MYISICFSLNQEDFIFLYCYELYLFLYFYSAAMKLWILNVLCLFILKTITLISLLQLHSHYLEDIIVLCRWCTVLSKYYNVKYINYYLYHLTEATNGRYEWWWNSSSILVKKIFEVPFLDIYNFSSARLNIRRILGTRS